MIMLETDSQTPLTLERATWTRTQGSRHTFTFDANAKDHRPAGERVLAEQVAVKDVLSGRASIDRLMKQIYDSMVSRDCSAPAPGARLISG